MADMIVIEHPDGRSVAVLPKDFERGIDGDYKGFKATRYESGEPYEGPKTAAAVTRAQEAPKGGKSEDKGA